MAGNDDRIPLSVQQSIATAIAFSDDDNTRYVASTVDINLLDAPLDDIVARCLEYRKKYQQAPGAHHIDEVLASILDDKGNSNYESYNRTLNAMLRLSDKLNTDFVRDNVVEFNHRRYLRAQIARASEVYTASKPNTIAEIKGLFRETLRELQQHDKSKGFRLSSPEALGFLDRSEFEYCPLGIKELDDFGIVPTRKELYIFMAARNRGKCLSGDTLILLANGERKQIKQVVEDRKDKYVLALNEVTGTIVKTPIDHYYKNGVKECWKITTQLGKEISATANHHFLTKAGWRSVEELTIEDFIVTSRFTPGLGKRKELSKEQARLLGYLIADGYLNGTSISFTKADNTIREDFEVCVKSMGDQVTWITRKNTCVGLISGVPKWSGNYTFRWLKELGLIGTKSRSKFVPKILFEQKDSIIAEFLKALYSCDGSVYSHKNNNCIEFSSSNKGLISEVRHLLLRFGIPANTKNLLQN
jgi:hypothetical protein